MAAVTTITHRRGLSKGAGGEGDINTWNYARPSSQEVFPCFLRTISPTFATVVRGVSIVNENEHQSSHIKGGVSITLITDAAH